MKRLFMVGLLLVVCMGTVGGVYANEGQPISAVTENGQQVVLYPDGTWRYVFSRDETDWTNVVWFTGFTAEHFDEDWSRSKPTYEAHVSLSFRFFNLSDKEIAGLMYDVVFKDAFGDEIETLTIKDNMIIPPNEFSPKKSWYFTPSLLAPLTKGSYEKLRPIVQAGTLRVVLTVTKIAFMDGTVVEFSKANWMAPSEKIVSPN